MAHQIVQIPMIFSELKVTFVVTTAELLVLLLQWFPLTNVKLLAKETLNFIPFTLLPSNN